MLKLVFPKQLMGIWPRNSYILGDLTWRSDLDLTLMIQDETSETSEFVPRLQCWQKWAHGEWNVYTSESVSLIPQVINFYELQRDPLLQNWLRTRHLSLPTPTPVDAAVFLMKQLSVDWQNLNLRPRARRKKWSRHFQQVGRVLDLNQNFILQIQSTVSELLKLTPENEQALWNGFLELKSRRRFNSHQEQAQFWQRNPWLWSFEIARFPFQSLSPLWSETQKQILLSEIRWEIFAALTQDWRTGGFDKHLTHLEQFLTENFKEVILQKEIQSARRCLKHH